MLTLRPACPDDELVVGVTADVVVDLLTVDGRDGEFELDGLRKNVFFIGWCIERIVVA